MLQVTQLSKDYPTARGPLRVLSGVSFDLAAGDAAAIMGPSGSGKSSLLYILGGAQCRGRCHPGDSRCSLRAA
jgi:ABC-type lipoprotein export system ATPase subunit